MRDVKLIGKTAWFWLEGGGGFHAGVIKRVECAGRGGRALELKSFTLKLANGQKKRVGPDRFVGPLAGVMLWGKLVRVQDAIAAEAQGTLSKKRRERRLSGAGSWGEQGVQGRDARGGGS